MHRDVKPENIHIASNGKVKLMDFGIAKAPDLSLTRTGMAMGTPYYMAPEQISGSGISHLIDIYAYGLLLFEILTGIRSVRGETMEQVFFQILNQPVDVAAMENAGVPPVVRDLVVRCSAKKPEDRPQSFGAIVGELRAILAGDSKSATQPVPKPAAQVIEEEEQDAAQDADMDRHRSRGGRRCCNRFLDAASRTGASGSRNGLHPGGHVPGRLREKARQAQSVLHRRNRSLQCRLL